MNRLPVYVLGAVGTLAVGVIGLFWIYGSPKNTDVGYRPKQPVPYSHKLHAGDLGIDCRYCHTAVEVSAHATIPPTQTCMNCHKLILTDSPKLLPVRESWASNTPIPWVRVHKTPDYCYFNHSAHLRAGVGCATCHGNVAQMDVVRQVQPLSMSWCLECHRKPEPYLRASGEVTSMLWRPPSNQTELAGKWRKERNINPPLDCSGCHR
jgi:hypothetical protein